MKHLRSALSGLALGEASSHEGLTVVPLISDFKSRLRYILLEDGLSRELVTITEVSEGGSVPELQVDNRADRPLLIVDGEELVGAKQNRVANLTMLMPAQTTNHIPVSCVEAGRWSYQRRDFRVSDRVQNARGRAERLADVRESLRTQGRRTSDQGRVWDSLAEESAALGARSATGAMGAMFESHEEKLGEFVAALKPHPRQIGAVFAMGRRHLGLDMFDKPATFAAFLPKLLRSYAVDTLGRDRNGGSGPIADRSASFVQAIVRARYDVHPAVGLGEDVGIVGPRLVAGALVRHHTVVHLTAFSERRDNDVEDGSRSRYLTHRRRRENLRNRVL